MPWCPVCKNEYREGITTCADCKVALVDVLVEDPKEQYELLVDLEREESAKKLVSYLEYSKFSAFYEPKEEDSSYSVFVLKKDYKEAKKSFRAFYTVELTAEYENILKQAIASKQGDSPLEGEAEEDFSEAEDDLSETKDRVLETEDRTSETEGSVSETEDEEEEEETVILSRGGSDYMNKAEKSADYQSSAVTFTIFGAGGLLVMLLHHVGVFHYFSTMSAIVATIMFAAFLIIGIDSFKRAAKAKKEAEEEERFVKELTAWLEANLTFEMLANADQEGLSQEVNFLNEIAEMKRIIQKQFGNLDASFLDRFTEEYYNEHFE